MCYQVEATAVAPVERVSRTKSLLSNEKLFSLCKKYFQHYSFEEFMAFCTEAKPKHLRINSIKQGEEMKIQFMLDKKRAFFGKGVDFHSALISMEQDIWRSFAVAEEI